MYSNDQSLSSWIRRNGLPNEAAGNWLDPEDLLRAVRLHIAGARDAAENRRWTKLPRKVGELKPRSPLQAPARAPITPLARRIGR